MGARHQTGGCLCGAVRYEVRGRVRGALHCHCRMCQRSGGSVAMTWADVSPDEFHVTRGAIREHASSGHGTRGFCADCGSPLTYHGRFGDLHDFGVTLASLDDPSVVRPAIHVWARSRVPGVVLDPGLPSHEEETPEFQEQVRDALRDREQG